MKNILILAAAVMLLGSCTSKKKYTLEGNIKDLTGKVYLFDEQNEAVDSAAVEQGAFRLTGDASAPAVRILRNAPDEKATFGVMLIVEPGKIVVADDPENPYRKRVTGTPSNDASTAYGDASNALITEYRNPETSDERRTAIEAEYDRLSRAAVDSNRTNYFGVLLLDQQLGSKLSEQELLDAIAGFSPEMQQTDLLTNLRQNAEQKVKTDVGQPYIDIEQPDAAGKNVSLKSAIENPANKYVLVDFWASWCNPCMGEVPHLKKTYDEFHKKGFEIYGVSFDKDKQKWLGAIDQNGMSWIQVSTLNAFDNEAAKDYAVRSIPANFLIDAQGKIVAANLRGEELYKKIAELLAE